MFDVPALSKAIAAAALASAASCALAGGISRPFGIDRIPELPKLPPLSSLGSSPPPPRLMTCRLVPVFGTDRETGNVVIVRYDHVCTP